MKSQALLDKTSKKFLDVDSKYAGDEFGSISWRVSLTETKRDGDLSTYSNNILRITDCYKVINLSVDARNQTEYSNRIEKIQVLIDSLQEMKKTLVQAKKLAGNKKYKQEEDE